MHVPSSFKGTRVAVVLLIHYEPRWSNKQIAAFLNVSLNYVQRIVKQYRIELNAARVQH